jgi:hypothetical protein
MNKFLKLILIAFLVSANYAFAVNENTQGSTSGTNFQKVASAGSQFVKIPVGARGTAMGGAYGSITDDLTSLYWNPAGLASVKNMSATFAYSSWFAGFSHNFAAISLPVGSQFTAALSFTNLTSDKIEITTIEKDQGTGAYYSSADMSVGLSFAGSLTDQFTFGVTAKMIRNSFSTLSSTGLAFDVGTMYNTGVEGIKLGFSIHGLGTEMRYEGQDLNSTKRLIEAANAAKLDFSYLAYQYNVPLWFRAGVSGEILKDETNTLVAAGDFVTLSDAPEQYSLGLEYAYDNMFYIRAGYAMGQEQLGIAGGIGLKYNSGGFDAKVDYSAQPNKDFGLVNRFSINVGF